MDSAHSFLVSLVFIIVGAEVQLTQFHVRDDYSIHNCTQLLPCGHRKIMRSQRKSECVQQALQIGADIIIYDGGNMSCILCQQTFSGGNFTAVDASLLVFVKGLKCTTQSWVKCFRSHHFRCFLGVSQFLQSLENYCQWVPGQWRRFQLDGKVEMLSLWNVYSNISNSINWYYAYYSLRIYVDVLAKSYFGKSLNNMGHKGISRSASITVMNGQL